MREQKFTLERLRQQRCNTLDGGLQGMLEMWWSSTRQRNTKPMLHGVTLHYSVVKRGKKNGKEE